MTCWNSILTKYDQTRRLSSVTIVNSKGDKVDFSSGSIKLKSVICKSKKDLKTIAILVSNCSTHYEISSRGYPLKEYSPLFTFELNLAANEEKVFSIEDSSECIKVCEIEELTFQLITLEKKKIDVDNLQVHLFYHMK